MPIIFVRTILIYLFLLISMRIMGKRQVGQLQLSELIVTFMLSELAVGPIASTTIPLLHAIVPILLLLSIEVIISYWMTKSDKIKRLLSGSPAVFIRKGELQLKTLADNRYEIEELLSELRLAGISDPAQVEYAILEENGRLSVFPKAVHSPLTPAMMDHPVQETGVAHPVIIDGIVYKEGLTHAGLDENRLHSILTDLHLNPEQIFLLTVNEIGGIYCVPASESSPPQEKS